MGGRKDDVTRTPKQHRKRPLSAVLEEFEVEDWELKDNLNTNTTTNNNNVEDNVDGNAKKNADTPLSFSSAVSSDCCKGDLKERGYSGAKTSTSSPKTVSPSSLNGVLELGNIPLTGSKENSPKNPRRTSPKIGRRQALIPNVSPKILRRAASPPFSSSGDIRDSDDDTPPRPSDMTRLRQTADRLHLTTRRPSVMQWRAQYVECPESPVLWSSGNGDVTGQHGDEDGRWTVERRERINTALDWIKNELLEMRTQDQQLARQLLTIRSDLHQLKLARSCEEHQDMLDNVQSELEELQEFADVLDLPTPTLTDSPLKHLGVTRMNFSARRFSMC